MSEKSVRPSRPSAQVFRRRRLAVLIAGLLVIGLLVWGGIALAGALRPGTSDTPTQQDSQGNTPKADEPGTQDPAAENNADPSASATGCVAEDVSVVASTSQSTLGPSQNPVLIMTIKNEGKFACTVNVGTSQQEFTVMSGSDRIFSTSDCLADPRDVEIIMPAGSSETARFTWERVRSAPGCKVVAAKPRPGWYGFTAKLGNLTSAKASFELK
ncbi:hypothetical protein CQ018_15790 [Arthrobacter sp. MYb227]|uniref:hypothetical protein n=1 Tax=Arthrobacter sp. MYb227 TaxID=1848601 RepID=UPI000CFCF4CD|nr:hypothetical protein [Arthrobacter sp. MYb227]PQZ89014.1 hypothetical protein CQ018_15790 [Arthrobacter sp. MYb227]